MVIGAHSPMLAPITISTSACGDIVPRIRRAIHAQRRLVRSAGRDHAEAAVVIDVAGSQADARELAHQVRLLGGERRAAVDRDGILAVLLLELAQTSRGEIERLVPLRRAESLVGSHQRIEQAVRVVALQIALDALGAKHAPIEWKVLPWLKPGHAVVANLELNAALLAAETAMSLDQLLSRACRILLAQPPGGV